MIAWCARGITGWLIRCGAVRESDRELYVYAAYSFLITVSPLFLTILIGTLLGKTWQSIVLILPFLLIRKFSGGVHAKHAIVCFICSCLLLLLCIELSGRIEGGPTLAAVTAVAMVKTLPRGYRNSYDSIRAACGGTFLLRMGERVGVYFTWDHSDCGSADTVYLFQMISFFPKNDQNR